MAVAQELPAFALVSTHSCPTWCFSQSTDGVCNSPAVQQTSSAQQPTSSTWQAARLRHLQGVTHNLPSQNEVDVLASLLALNARGGCLTYASYRRVSTRTQPCLPCWPRLAIQACRRVQVTELCQAQLGTKLGLQPSTFLRFACDSRGAVPAQGVLEYILQRSSMRRLVRQPTRAPAMPAMPLHAPDTTALLLHARRSQLLLRHCMALLQRVLAGCHDTYGAGYLDTAQLAAFVAHAVQQLADAEAVQRYLPLGSYASIAAAKVALLLGKGGR